MSQLTKKRYVVDSLTGFLPTLFNSFSAPARSRRYIVLSIAGAQLVCLLDGHRTEHAHTSFTRAFRPHRYPPSATAAPNHVRWCLFLRLVFSTYTHLCTSDPSSSSSSPSKTGKRSTSGSSHNAKYERTLFVNSGQPLDDMYRYLPSPPASRLLVAESRLR